MSVACRVLAASVSRVTLTTLLSSHVHSQLPSQCL